MLRYREPLRKWRLGETRQTEPFGARLEAELLQAQSPRVSRHEVFESSGLGRSFTGERSYVKMLGEAGPQKAPDLLTLGWLG